MTVYFARASGTDHLKIGYTDGEPVTRLKSLQTGCPYRLEIEDAVEGSCQTECFVHEALRAYRTPGGEWFRITVEQLRAFIDSQPRLFRQGEAVPFLEYLGYGKESMHALLEDLGPFPDHRDLIHRIRHTECFSHAFHPETFKSLTRLLDFVRSEGSLAESATIAESAGKYVDYVLKAGVSPQLRAKAFAELEEAYASFEKHTAEHKESLIKRFRTPEGER